MWFICDFFEPEQLTHCTCYLLFSVAEWKLIAQCEISVKSKKKIETEKKIVKKIIMAATGATPRKFAEKIAMHNQKGAEEEAEFRKIMAECASVKTPGPDPRATGGHSMPTPMQQVRVRI